MADEQDYEQEEGYEESYVDPRSRLPRWLAETPYWAISAVLHAILILAIGSYVIYQKDQEEISSKIYVKQQYKPPEYDPTKKRAMRRKPEILEELKKKPLIKLKPDQITPTIPKGTDERNLTNKNLRDNWVNDAFGTGSGAAGAYGNRNGRGSLWREGGSEATESAVLAALMWLKRHQHPDGHWSSSDFFPQCRDPQNPCGMKDKGKAYTNGTGFEGYDVGVTALAMLAYLGYGHTHVNGEYREFKEVMRRAMEWMNAQQVKSSDPQINGVFGKTDVDEWIYNHAIATMAMAELLVISRDVFSLSKSVEAATEYCLRAQNEKYGWRYKYRGGKNDTSVTGWMVLALKTAKACSEGRLIKIDKNRFKQHFEWALTWFERATSKMTGVTGYTTPGDEGSRLQKIYPEPYPFSKSLSCMTAVAMLCRLFAGESQRSDSIKRAVGVLMKEPPTWREARGKRKSKINIYYWYYASYAMFQYGGPQWRSWNKDMIEALVPTQRVAGCEDGSWDPIGEWGASGGRVYATAIGAMTLEVYYRFLRQSEL
ncbi:MAG: hypothetical protein V3T77_10730 [Planctomycetota bacterium]